MLLPWQRRSPESRQHRVHGDRGMPHKAGFSARREEAHPQIVIVRVGLQQKGRVTVVQFARDQLHLLLVEAVSIQHHAGRIAAEALRGEGIDLKDTHFLQICHEHNAIIRASNLGVALAGA